MVSSVPPRAAAATTGGPTDGARIRWIDALRGFALIGILIANLPLLAGYHFVAPEVRDALRGADLAPAVAALTGVLVDAKFYALFSLLFGLGFGLQVKRAQEHAHDPGRAHGRRMLVLLGIGLAHAWLVWWGDILWVYALLGLVLLAFRRASQRAVLRGALVFLTMPFLVYAVFLAIAMPDPFLPKPGTSPGASPVALVTRAFAEGGYPDVVGSNMMMSAGSAVRRALRFQLFRILGMFLLGVWLAGFDLRQRTPALQAMFRRWLWLAVGLGLPLNIAYVVLGGGDGLLPASAAGLLAVGVASLGIPLLALGYVAVFALFWRRDDDDSLLVAGGRTALSMYVMQSLIGVLLFYHIGFGLWGRLGRVELLLLALVVVHAQLLLARAWLRRNGRGPMEALWRRLSRRPST